MVVRLSPGARAKGDVQVFVGGVPGVHVLHVCPDWSAAQLVAQLEKTAHLDLSGCYLIVGHKIWTGGSVEEFGIEGGVRITVHARLLGASAFQCWTYPQCKMDKCWLARMSWSTAS